MKTISITLDEKLLEGVDRAARVSRTSRSELFRQALREWLAAQRHRKLAAADRTGYERQPVAPDEFRGLMARQPLDDEGWT